MARQARFVPIGMTLMNGARAADVAGGVEIEAAREPWAYAAVLPIQVQADASVVDARVAVDCEVLRGDIGVFAAETSADYPAGGEAIVSAGPRKTIVLPATPDLTRICIRNGASAPSRFRLYSLRAWPRRSVDISSVVDDVLPTMLLWPGPVALAALAAALSARGAAITPEGIGALVCRAPIANAYGRLWTDELGALVHRETEALIELMPTYDPSRMDPKQGYLGRDFFTMYLRQSAIRVYHLLQVLSARDVRPAAAIEVGSLFGQFAVCLQRLGWSVTVVDRYRAYGGAFDGYVAYLRGRGITVVETDRTDENAAFAALGTFDLALAMAVIEHIPHTPRLFLSSLVSHVRAGGHVALDTPNIARYWNRRLLAAGRTVHQRLEDQFYSEVPYEGHHREYTAAEMVWMLEQCGCRDIDVSLFDYNLLQFPELSREHVDALLAIAVDPSQADTILVCGRTGASA